MLGVGSMELIDVVPSFMTLQIWCTASTICSSSAGTQTSTSACLKECDAGVSECLRFWPGVSKAGFLQLPSGCVPSADKFDSNAAPCPDAFYDALSKTFCSSPSISTPHSTDSLLHTLNRVRMPLYTQQAHASAPEPKA